MSETDEIFMQELKEEFKESVSKNLAEMSALFKENKFDEIATIAHDIKGTSGIFGLDEGTEIAKDLQYAAQDKRAADVERLIGQLTGYMKNNEILD
jgi:HPt (histidine-containing phosphotransfer) domain-containing protein